MILFQEQACSQVQNLLGGNNQSCDTTQIVGQFSMLDITQPFYMMDTLADLRYKASKVYVVLQTAPNAYAWAGIYVQEGDPPIQLEQAGMPDNFQRILLSTMDKVVLSGLVSTPAYLYDRWLPILEKPREDFLAKRDALLDSLEEKYPNYDIKINSDLRSANVQSKYLKNGSSASPLSQHQFGLASDIGAWVFTQQQRTQKIKVKVKGKRKKQTKIRTYTVTVKRQGTKVFDDLGEFANYYQLAWGGNFLGFVDPNHLQYFENSAAMLKVLPELRYEFEPYRDYYQERIQKMTDAGKADKVEDTKLLVETLNALRTKQPCICQDNFVTPTSINTIQNYLQIAGYQATTDLLFVINQQNRTLQLIAPNNLTLKYKLGKWQ